MLLRDGRALTWAGYGDPEGRPIIALHGTPGSHLKFAMTDRAAQHVGLRIIAVDRWGYGGSAAPALPRLADYGADLCALADAIGAERFGLLGISGGGPFAAAAAANHPDRVPALALVAPVGPIAGTPLWHMKPFHSLCFRGLPRIPGAVRLAFAVFRGVLAISRMGAVRLAAARAGPADRQILRDRRASAGLARAFRDGLASTLAGPVIDLQLLAAPWQVQLGHVKARSRLWLGDRDNNVPLVPARRLAAMIPGCERVDLVGQGHYWASHHHGDVLAWLAGAMAEPRA